MKEVQTQAEETSKCYIILAKRLLCRQKLSLCLVSLKLTCLQLMEMPIILEMQSKLNQVAEEMAISQTNTSDSKVSTDINVKYQEFDVVHGVSYEVTEKPSEEIWTPVVARRRRK